MITSGWRRGWTSLAAVVVLALGTAGCDLPWPPAGDPANPSPSPSGSPSPAPSPSPDPSPDPSPPSSEYPVPQGAVFVAPGGSDDAAGTEQAPYATVARAVERAPRGGTVVLRGGTYREGGIAVTKPLTLQPFPGEDASLLGSQVVEGWRADAGAWVKDGWTTTFTTATQDGCEPSTCLDPEHPEADRREMVFVDGQPQRQVLTRAAVEEGTFLVDGRRLVLGSDPTGRTVEVTVQDRGILLNRPAEGATVRGLRLAHYAGPALFIPAHEARVEGNVVELNATKGVALIGKDAVVRANTLRRNGHVGLSAFAADRLLLEGNTIEGNNTEGFAKTWSAAGAKIVFSKDVRATDNRILDNDALGLWFDVAADRAVMVRNYARGNLAGLFFEISRDAVIASNVAEDNGMGILIAKSAHAQVWNNTLVNNKVNVRVAQGARTFAQADLDRGVTTQVSDIVLRNNLLSGQGVLLRAIKTPCDGPEMFSAVDTNGYHRAAGGGGSLIDWPLPGPGCRVSFGELAGFRNRTGFERSGTEIDDPLFVAAPSGDYRLQPGSPAKGKGAPLPPEVADAIGQPAGQPVDLGALHLAAPGAG